MASRWRQVRLADHITLLMGFPFKSSEFTSAPGVKLARGKNVKRSEFEWSEGETKCWHAITPELEPYELRAGDILIGMDGSRVGENWVCVSEYDLPCLLVQRVARLRAADGMVQGYLKYLIGNPSFTAYVKAVHTGTSVPHISGKQIGDYLVPLPPVEVQGQIAHILGKLDDKIELNRWMNRTLEKMAAAIFKSWFIDFDPVHAKAEGRDTNLPTEIADFFPDTFQDSDLGSIPKGWRAGVVGDLAEQAIGGQWGSDSQEDGTVPAICLRGCDMEDLRASGFAPKAPTRFVKTTAISKRLPSERDVLIAASGAGPCGRPLWCATRIGELYKHPVIYSNFVKRFTTPSPTHAVYLDRFLIRKFNDRTIHDYINGTSVPNLDASGLLSTCKLLVPPTDVLQAFFEFCQPGFKRLYARQSVVLARLRDTLLPKLLSGEIELPEAEAIAEEVS